MSDALGSSADRNAVGEPFKEQWRWRADPAGVSKQDATETPPAVVFVQSALHDLQRSLVRLPSAVRDRWLPTAFNDWYCPAVRRGFVGGMAPAFDIGVTLMEPAAEIRADDGHGKLLQWVKERPFIHEYTVRAISRRTFVPSDEAVSMVTWTIVEALLRCLLGVWDSAAATAAAGRELPSIQFRRGRLLIHTSAYGKTPTYELELGSIDHRTADSAKPDAQHSPVPESFTAARRVRDCMLPTVQALGVRLFAARVAGLLPELTHKLDYELVEASLLSPVLVARDHEPPRRLPADVATTRQSQQPGAIAGVTRVETRRPGDPLIDVLPSELMLLRRSRTAGLANVLYGRPLVVVHERERDVVPKHRALVCYVVDAHQSSANNHRSVLDERISVCPYRDGYVYAKRQVVDMLRDLANSEALARRMADIEIEAAVFAIPPGSERAVVHQRISIERFKREATGDATVDRLGEMVRLAEVIPGYFIRYASELDRSRALAVGPAVDVLPPDVVHYLVKTSRQGRYRVIHLVIVGVDNASRLLERLYRFLHYQSGTPLRITLIGLNLDELDSDVRLVGLREPAWTYLEVASLREAVTVSSEPREVTPLSELRARFVETVLGKEIEPTEAQLGRIQSS